MHCMRRGFHPPYPPPSLTRRGFSDTCQGGHGSRHSTQAADPLLLAPSPSGEGWGEGRAPLLAPAPWAHKEGFLDTCQGGHGACYSTQAADPLLLAPSPSGESEGGGGGVLRVPLRCARFVIHTIENRSLVHHPAPNCPRQLLKTLVTIARGLIATIRGWRPEEV